MSSKSKQSECIIKLDLNVITNEINSAIIISFIKYLFIHENFIPFRYETFKYYSDHFSKIISDADDWKMAIINKQREHVIDASTRISKLFNEIQLMFKNNHILEVGIVFGATVSNPNQVYIIQLPNCSNDHEVKNHRLSEDKLIDCIKQLAENSLEESKISKNATNMFLFFKKTVDSKNYNENLFSNDEFYDIISKCYKKVILFELSDEVVLNCCKELVIFEDIANLNLNSEYMETDYVIKNTTIIDTQDNCIQWIQSDYNVKKYDNKKIGGKFIWDYLN